MHDSWPVAFWYVPFEHTIGASSLSMGQYVPTLQGSHDDLSAETYVLFKQAIAMLVFGQLKNRVIQ